MLTYSNIPMFGTPRSLYAGFGGYVFGEVPESPDVKKLQQALIQIKMLGKGADTGKMNEKTLQAVYNVFRKDIAALSKQAPGDVKKYVSDVNDFFKDVDDFLGKAGIGGFKLDFGDLIGHVDYVVSVMTVIDGIINSQRSPDDDSPESNLAGKAQGYIDKLYTLIGKAAGPLNKVLITVYRLTGQAPTSTPGAVTCDPSSPNYRMCLIKAGASASMAFPPGGQTPTFITPEQAAAEAERTKYRRCIARYNKTNQNFSIYCPTPSGGFGESVTPAPPAGTVKVGTVKDMTEAAGATRGEDEATPLTSQPKFWFAVVGGLAVVLGGGYLLFRD